jgi:hypothetical protein
LSAYETDLVVLTADKNMAAAVNGLLSRPQSLGISQVTWKSYVHTERDPGCLLRGHDFLRPMSRRCAHCLLVFDRQGCGHEDKSREAIEQIVEKRLARSGWPGRSAAVVLDPELEMWVWSDSPQVDVCMGWESRRPGLREWLRDRGVWPEDSPKPADPKAAVEAALREVRKPRSSAIYQRLAGAVGFERCCDPAFLKFRDDLRSWFPPV